ncbi:hypothetical protein [Nocardia sp. NPDC005998]|uniref:hypothetical protein n=1 Tax=Nocardia sp. NPDC005998 TaxID=3156894 RepID=UPI0033B1B77F
MTVNAVVSKQCPAVGTVFIVPSNLGVQATSLLVSGGDEIFVDIAPTNVQEASFADPIATLHLLGPTGAEFQIPDTNVPNARHWSYPVVGDKTRIQCLADGKQEHINRGSNSLSYRFPITGLAGRDCTVEIKMTAHPIDVLADSCLWTVAGLGADTTNTRGKTLDALG